MRESQIKKHEEGFVSQQTDSNGTKYTISEIQQGDATVLRAVPQGVTDYYYEQKEKKQAIVVHFTAGYLKGDLASLCKQSNHVSVPYLIARNGNIYQLFDPDYWAYHLGKGAVGGNSNLSMRTVPIEISNIGYLVEDGDNLKTIYGDIYCSKSETSYYTKIDSPFRNQKYFATFTDVQYNSLNDLLRYLCGKYNIPREFIQGTARFKVFSTKTDARNFRGICTHINFRDSGKWDIGPAFDWDCIVEDEKKVKQALDVVKEKPKEDPKPIEEKPKDPDPVVEKVEEKKDDTAEKPQPKDGVTIREDLSFDWKKIFTAIIEFIKKLFRKK